MSIVDGHFTPKALEAILGRADAVLKNNVDPAPMRKGKDWHYLKLRPGDRLTRLPDSDTFLETKLVALAEAMGSKYLVEGYYPKAKLTERESGNALQALKWNLQKSESALPLSLADALFLGEKFQLQTVHDEIATPGLRIDSMPALSPGDVVAIIAWQKNTKKNGWLQAEGKGFHIGDPSMIVHSPVGKVDEGAIVLNDGLQVIRSTSEGRLYVENYMYVKKDLWSPLGAWGNIEYEAPNDDIAYQILKVTEK